MSSGVSELVRAYQAGIDGSDRLPAALEPAVLGLAGEVGSILAVAKKLVREGDSYTSFRNDLAEEFGDAIWYLSALCRRAKVPLHEVLESCNVPERTDRNRVLLELHEASAGLVPSPGSWTALQTFGEKLVFALRSFGLDLELILAKNLEKVGGAFLPLSLNELPDFDVEFPSEEQLPREFKIHLVQRASGKTHMSLNGVFIGDPLLDNVTQADGYRFHDVFHLANAAVLHWSPVTRSLLKLKRKSRPDVDNTQDNGRAIVVEEGLSAWLFQRAGPLGYFDGAESVPYNVLKTIQEFVSPYEVSACPPSAWERAILLGYAAFRQIREKERGYLIGDRSERTIVFKEE